MRLIRNLYNLIKLLSVIELSINREEILIYYIDNYILIKEGQIKIYSPKLILDYEEMFEHCDEWFINSSPEQKDIYLNSVIKEVIESKEGIVCQPVH